MSKTRISTFEGVMSVPESLLYKIEFGKIEKKTLFLKTEKRPSSPSDQNLTCIDYYIYTY